MKLFKKLKNLFSNSKKGVTVNNTKTFASFNQKIFDKIDTKEWYLLDSNISLHIEELEKCVTFSQLFNRAIRILIAIGKLTSIQNQTVDNQLGYYKILRKYSMTEVPPLEIFKQFNVEFLPGWVYNVSDISFDKHVQIDILIQEYCKTYTAIINKYNDI